MQGDWASRMSRELRISRIYREQLGGGRAAPRELSSENIEVVTGNDLAAVELANFLQHLSFAAGIAAILCARLVTACIAAVVQHQEMGLCPVRDLRKLPCRGMECLTVLLPFRRDFLERSLCICLVNYHVAFTADLQYFALCHGVTSNHD